MTVMTTKDWANMVAAAILRKAATLVETSGWCQGAGARTEHGRAVWPDNPDAQCFCMLGAIQRASKFWLWPGGHGPRREAVLAAQKAIGGSPIAWWNDHPGRTKEEVAAKLLEAADLAEGRWQA